MNKALKPKTDGIGFYLLILTSFFLLLEISFFIQCNSIYLSDYTFVSDNLHIPTIIIPEIVLFLLAQLFVHVVYFLIIWLIAELVSRLLSLSGNKKLGFAMALWLWGIMTLLVMNQYYFPHSKFVTITSLFLPTLLVTKIALATLLTGSAIAVGLALWEVRFKAVCVSLLVAFSVFIGNVTGKTGEISTGTPTHPNVILIGIDSLRPDFLGYFGSTNSTPFIDSFLKQATVFNDAVTPLARTFPSWSSLLTGEYPRENRIRSNLTNQAHLNLQNTLPAILERNGYKTIYATDETRFSNIDKNFGFDKVITPPMGLNDFLLGTFNDFPISNLLVNTFIGKWLFPYSYANRPVSHTYDPNSFLNLLRDELPTSSHKPLFLSVHFCLTHHPYRWANSPAENLSPQELYINSIKRVDQQVKDFFVMLKQRGLLNHAIVVLLSDHGEALEFPGDRITEKDLFVSAHHAPPPKFYPSDLNNEEDINKSTGHGTDVLGLTQYRILLGFKFFGLGENKATLIPSLVSTLDLKPTILNLLNIPSPTSSGMSLAGVIKGESQKTLPLRHIFLESDFSPASVRTVYPEMHAVFLDGIDLFEIDPLKARLTVKPKMMEKIINSKQIADIYGDWMLALYPQDQNHYMPILVNLKNGKWTNDLQSQFAKQSPAYHMLSRLKAFYGKELGGRDVLSS